jgi:membrane-associated phospholipid phosphatase
MNMKKNLPILVSLLLITAQLHAQMELSVRTTVGNWKTWFITSGKDFTLPPPPSSSKEEVAQVVSRQQNLDSAGLSQIAYWTAGAPGYRWQDMISKLWMTDTSNNGALANMLVAVATYDATVAAWNTKYAYNRPRPFNEDNRIKVYGLKLETPSYPCEHSVAAGVAATIIAHFYPAMAETANRQAQQVMESRISAGAAFPSDTRAGFELGKRIAEKEIEHTKSFVPKGRWNGKIPNQPGLWTGKMAMFPLAGKSKTVVLDSSSQFRPGPPPDFAKDMAELKNFQQTFRSQANAFYWASQDFWSDALNKKIFEYNLHLDPPRAARLYAIKSIAMYDAFVACWDAKYTYWGIRPEQYDSTFHPIMPAPPFPGYPSGHAAISGALGELYSYFFPADRAYFAKKAKEGAESRFQAGIHFRTDNDVALELGRKVATTVIQKVSRDEAGNESTMSKKKKTVTKIQ